MFSGNILREAAIIQIIVNERTWHHLPSYGLELKFSPALLK